MSTISEELNLLINTKNALKQSLINKEVEVSDTDRFDTYPAKIDGMVLGIPTYETLEALQAVIGAAGDRAVVQTADGTFDGIYEYIDNTWTEIFSTRRYEGTLTPEDYATAEAVAQEIKGGE